MASIACAWRAPVTLVLSVWMVAACAATSTVVSTALTTSNASTLTVWAVERLSTVSFEVTNPGALTVLVDDGDRGRSDRRAAGIFDRPGDGSRANLAVNQATKSNGQQQGCARQGVFHKHHNLQGTVAESLSAFRQI